MIKVSHAVTDTPNTNCNETCIQHIPEIISPNFMNIPISSHHPLSLENFILPYNNISTILNKGVFLK